MSRKNNTEYYVIDCDEYDYFEIGGRLTAIFNTVNELKPTAITLKYGEANLVCFDFIGCMFLPDDKVAITVGASDVTFNPLHKVLNIDVTIDKMQTRTFITVNLKIIDKGGGTA